MLATLLHRHLHYPLHVHLSHRYKWVRLCIIHMNWCVTLPYTMCNSLVRVCTCGVKNITGFLSSPSLLERGRMFVFSTEQLRSLFPSSFPPPLHVLDVGAGDGHVTANLRRYLGANSSIHVTESSSVMRRVLRKKGYV